MAGVTSIKENIIEKHYTEEEEEESTWKTMQSRILKIPILLEMPFKNHSLIPTREKEIEVVLEIPLW